MRLVGSNLFRSVFLVSVIGAYAFAISCSRVPNGNIKRSEAETRYRLIAIKEIIEACARDGVAISQFETVAEFLQDSRVGAKQPGELRGKDLTHDAWNNDFLWVKDPDSRIFSLRVISSGLNGILENGGVDDIELLLTIDADSHVWFRLHPAEL